MATPKQITRAGAAAVPAAERSAAAKAAAKKASAKAARRAQDVPRVSKVTAGGYTVYGSPVQPKVLTTRQIAEAIAELD